MAFDFYAEEDRKLAELLPPIHLCGCDWTALPEPEAPERHTVCLPDGQYAFLHECALIGFKGRLFAAWYHNRTQELSGETPICWRYSDDEGKTWSERRVLVTDAEAQILYCPPVFGIQDGILYLLINEMVSADHMHALDLYRYDEVKRDFEFVWSRPVPFKLNTNLVVMDSGRLLLPGRIAEMDGFPTTPAVLISDQGAVDAAWRLVSIRPDGVLPDGSRLVHPELSAICDEADVLIFCRDDQRKVPLVYRSSDSGESWAGPFASDLPFISSKIYSGTLSDGRHYAVGNLPGSIYWKTRDRLALFVTDKGGRLFTRGIMLRQGRDARSGADRWHYPCAWEQSGKLFVLYTMGFPDGSRGAEMTVIPLDILDR